MSFVFAGKKGCSPGRIYPKPASVPCNLVAFSVRRVMGERWERYGRLKGGERIQNLQR